MSKEAPTSSTPLLWPEHRALLEELGCAGRITPKGQFVPSLHDATVHHEILKAQADGLVVCLQRQLVQPLENADGDPLIPPALIVVAEQM